MKIKNGIALGMALYIGWGIAEETDRLLGRLFGPALTRFGTKLCNKIKEACEDKPEDETEE